MSNTQSETLLGASSILLASLVIHDPTVEWLQNNIVRISVVGFGCSFIAFVLCLLVDTVGWKKFLGRVLGAGAGGVLCASIMGSAIAAGTGPTVSSIIVIVIGAGGWILLLSLHEFFRSKKESGEIASALSSVWDRWGRIARGFLGIENATVSGKPEPAAPAKPSEPSSPASDGSGNVVRRS